MIALHRKRTLARILSAALALCIVTVMAPTSAVAAANMPSIKLSQTHFFMGKSEVTIAKDAIRIENTSKLRYVLVARAPDWKVTVYRPDDKTYFTQNIEVFRDGGLMSDLLIGRKDRFMRGKIYRHSAMKLDNFNIERLTSSWCTIKYMELGNIAPLVEQILYAVHKQPTNGGIPIYFTYLQMSADFVTGMKAGGKFQTTLDTAKIVKVKVPPSAFNVPAGFKKAQSIRDVVAGSAAKREVEESDALFFK